MIDFVEWNEHLINLKWLKNEFYGFNAELIFALFLSIP
jgi:hypothetical protein